MIFFIVFVCYALYFFLKNASEVCILYALHLSHYRPTKA